MYKELKKILNVTQDPAIIYASGDNKLFAFTEFLKECTHVIIATTINWDICAFTTTEFTLLDDNGHSLAKVIVNNTSLQLPSDYKIHYVSTSIIDDYILHHYYASNIK